MALGAGTGARRAGEPRDAGYRSRPEARPGGFDLISKSGRQRTVFYRVLEK
jgi:hypothetical protein